jgi:hypothetical protein
MYQSFAHSQYRNLIGGDKNEDPTKNSNDYRTNYIKLFINERHLEIKFAGNTFINSAGQPCSEIDYFLYSKSSNRNFSRKYIMDDLAVDVSDHYPICIKFYFQMTIIYKLINVVCSIVITVLSKIFIYVSSY